MRMPWGKHEGEHVENVPMSYLWSLWESGRLKPGPLREAIRQRIEPERYDIVLTPDRGVSARELTSLARSVFARLNAQDRSGSTIPTPDGSTPAEGTGTV